MPREEIFLTSKIWPPEYGEGKTLPAIDEMLKRLGTDYIDLLLLHQPFGDALGAWKELEKAVELGKVKNIGISNLKITNLTILSLTKKFSRLSIRWNAILTVRTKRCVKKGQREWGCSFRTG